MKKIYTISLREDGKYQIIRTGNQKPTRVFDSEREALEYAEELKKDSDVIVNVETDSILTKETDVNVQPEPKQDDDEHTEPVGETGTEVPEAIQPKSAEPSEQKANDSSVSTDDEEAPTPETETEENEEEKPVGFFKRLWRKLFG